MIKTCAIKGADRWFPKWADRVAFPTDVVALHLASSGTDSHADQIVAADLRVLRDGEVIEDCALTLDWTKEPSLVQNALRQRLRETANSLQAAGRSFPYTWNRLAQTGDDVRTCLALLVNLLDRQPPATFLVGHGLWSFQLPLLRSNVQNWLGRSLAWPGDRCLDTGLIEKARQLNELPKADEPLGAFWDRISGLHAVGVRWSQAHCLNCYDLPPAAQERDGAFLAQHLLEAYQECAAIDYSAAAYSEDDVDPFGFG